MSKQSGKAEESKKEKTRKPPEYRRFEKLLKQVVKAPPLPKREASLEPLEAPTESQRT
jgi:hypothetical protein